MHPRRISLRLIFRRSFGLYAPHDIVSIDHPCKDICSLAACPHGPVTMSFDGSSQFPPPQSPPKPLLVQPRLGPPESLTVRAWIVTADRWMMEIPGSMGRQERIQCHTRAPFTIARARSQVMISQAGTERVNHGLCRRLSWWCEVEPVSSYTGASVSVLFNVHTGHLS